MNSEQRNRVWKRALEKAAEIGGRHEGTPASHAQQASQDLLRWLEGLRGGRSIRCRENPDDDGLLWSFPLDETCAATVRSGPVADNLLASLQARRLLIVGHVLPAQPIARNYTAILCDGLCIGLAADLAEVLGEGKPKVSFKDWPADQFKPLIFPILLADLQ